MDVLVVNWGLEWSMENRKRHLINSPHEGRQLSGSPSRRQRNSCDEVIGPDAGDIGRLATVHERRGSQRYTHGDVRNVIGEANVTFLTLWVELGFLDVLSTMLASLEGHAAVVAEEGRLNRERHGRGRHDRSICGQAVVGRGLMRIQMWGAGADLQRAETILLI